MKTTGFDKYIDLVHKTQDKKILEDLLYGVTTPYERTGIVNRIEIVEQLLKGRAQQDIALDLGVGIATVTRGSRELRLGRFKVLQGKR